MSLIASPKQLAARPDLDSRLAKLLRSKVDAAHYRKGGDQSRSQDIQATGKPVAHPVSPDIPTHGDARGADFAKLMGSPEDKGVNKGFDAHAKSQVRTHNESKKPKQLLSKSGSATSPMSRIERLLQGRESAAHFRAGGDPARSQDIRAMGKPVAHPVSPNIPTHGSARGADFANLMGSPEDKGVNKGFDAHAKQKVQTHNEKKNPQQLLSKSGSATSPMARIERLLQGRESAAHFRAGGDPARSQDIRAMGKPVAHSVSPNIPTHGAARGADFANLMGSPEDKGVNKGFDNHAKSQVDTHNESKSPQKLLSKSGAAADFRDFLYKTAVDFKTQQKLDSAKKMHNVPKPGPRDKTNRFGQSKDWDYSGYSAPQGSGYEKDLSGVSGYKSLAGGWEPDQTPIHDARARLEAEANATPDPDAHMRNLGVTRIGQGAAAPGGSPQAQGGTPAPPAAPTATYPAQGTSEYDAAVKLRARGSDDYRAARNGQGYMGYKPDGTWGLVTPDLQGQPVQPMPTPQAAPQPAPPAAAPQPAPPAAAAPPASGPGRHTGLPPDPFNTSPQAPTTPAPTTPAPTTPATPSQGWNPRGGSAAAPAPGAPANIAPAASTTAPNSNETRGWGALPAPTMGVLREPGTPSGFSNLGGARPAPSWLGGLSAPAKFDEQMQRLLRSSGEENPYTALNPYSDLHGTPPWETQWDTPWSNEGR